MEGLAGKRGNVLDENEAELGVTVLAVGLEMLADGDSLLDKPNHHRSVQVRFRKNVGEGKYLTCKDPRESQERVLNGSMSAMNRQRQTYNAQQGPKASLSSTCASHRI